MKQLVKAFEELKINYDDILLKKYETYMEGILKWMRL